MDKGASYYRRFLDGDGDGFVEIIKEYKDGLTLYLNGYVNNMFTAEELMEETFFKIVMKKPRFRGNHSFKTWLYTIGRNVAIDHLRRHKSLSDTPFEELERALAEEDSVEQAYLREERKITVHKALRTLTPAYRQVLYLIYFEGFSNAEAAQAMKKNTRQIENLVYRAKQALRSTLEKEGFAYEELP